MEERSNMSMNPTPLTQRPAWQALEQHYQQIRGLHLRTLFAEDPGRGERFSLEATGIYLDYSKNRITGETLPLLLQLAQYSSLRYPTDATDRAASQLDSARSTRRRRGPWSGHARGAQCSCAH